MSDLARPGFQAPPWLDEAKMHARRPDQTHILKRSGGFEGRSSGYGGVEFRVELVPAVGVELCVEFEFSL